MLKYITNSPQQTSELAKQLTKLLLDGDTICLSGDLGAGKTLFAKEIAAGLGITEPVTSPTFTVLNIYESNDIHVNHFDLYRLDNEEELEDIGFEEYTHSGGITLIEWPDKFKQAMPEQHLWIDIQKGQEDDRIITIHGVGNRYEKLCEELKNIANFRAGYGNAGM